MLLHIAGSNLMAVVDDDMSHLAVYRWRLDKGGYVMRRASGRYIYLHHVVLPGQRYPTFLRDHVSRDKLDNRRANLRWLTSAESNQNRGPARRNRTGIRGVRFDEGKGQYLATVQTGGKAVVRRWFDDPVKAGSYLDEVRPAILPFAA